MLQDQKQIIKILYVKNYLSHILYKYKLQNKKMLHVKIVITKKKGRETDTLVMLWGCMSRDSGALNFLKKLRKIRREKLKKKWKSQIYGIKDLFKQYFFKIIFKKYVKFKRNKKLKKII